METNDEKWLLAEKYAGKKTDGFFADVRRLEEGEPLPYIIGYTPFLETRIYLDSHPLIPRVETEFWVEKVIAEIRERSIENLSVLDLCAGSGCIGISVLKELPHAQVDFGEIDTQHHTTILKNIVKNELAGKNTNIYGGDLFDEINDRYDYILSNPPYIDPKLDRTDESVTKYEPESALYGGLRGMAYIQTIIENAPQHLKEGGVLAIEHEPEQTDEIHDIGARFGFTSKTHKDQYDTDRFTYLTYAGM